MKPVNNVIFALEGYIGEPELGYSGEDRAKWNQFTSFVEGLLEYLGITPENAKIENEEFVYLDVMLDEDFDFNTACVAKDMLEEQYTIYAFQYIAEPDEENEIEPQVLYVVSV